MSEWVIAIIAAGGVAYLATRAFGQPWVSGYRLSFVCLLLGAGGFLAFNTIASSGGVCADSEAGAYSSLLAAADFASGAGTILAFAVAAVTLAAGGGAETFRRKGLVVLAIGALALTTFAVVGIASTSPWNDSCRTSVARADEGLAFLSLVA